MGWKVIRFWADELDKIKCIGLVEQSLRKLEQEHLFPLFYALILGGFSYLYLEFQNNLFCTATSNQFGSLHS